MATSVDVPSPLHLTKEATSLMMASSSPIFSPASDKRFWSTLRSRVDELIEDRNAKNPTLQSFPSISNSGETNTNRAKRLKEDSLLLLRGFDSISQTLSQLSNNLDNALQGAREVAKPPTLTDIFHSSLKNSEAKEENPKQKRNQEEEGGCKIGAKRKFESSECWGDKNDKGDGSEKLNDQSPKAMIIMKKAKNIAISMATKAATLARELKSMKSDLCFMQERCGLLEEENRRLRDGFGKGIRPEEDDLVRLQMEALLAEKSRLANENASLVRENQCLHQLVEYHQMTSQDLSASYEDVIKGMCLDFSSPIEEEEEEEDDDDDENGDCNNRVKGTTRDADIFSLSTNLEEYFDEEKHH